MLTKSPALIDHIGMFAVDQGDHPPDQAAVPGLRSGVQVGEQGDAVAVESGGELVRAQCDPVDVYVRAAESSAPDQDGQRQGCGASPMREKIREGRLRNRETG